MNRVIRVGDAIRAKRRSLDMSARALSLKAGLSESYVGKIEKGEVTDISLHVFAQISQVLGLTDREIAMIVRWAAPETASFGSRPSHSTPSGLVGNVGYAD